MYTDIRTILKDASEKNYGVIATSAINMETARGIVAAATEKNAPIIFLLGQNMMRTHAKAELMIPMIRKLAEYTPVPVATCLDHGSDPERIMYAFRNGFSSIMFDGSLYSMEENMRKTKEYADLCHQFNMGIEGELGHVGIAAQGDNLKTDCYTDPKDAADFARFTGVDCLAIAVGTAHGEYPKGLIPHINFDRIRECKTAVKDEHIVRAFKNSHVLAYFIKTSERDDLYGSFLYLFASCRSASFGRCFHNSSLGSLFFGSSLFPWGTLSCSAFGL